MNGWQEPKDGKRIYIITDNTKMDGFTDYIKSEDVERLYVTYSESRVNLGIHYYRNKLYTSNLVGICRIKSVDDETLYDAEGNELLIKVIPRFNVKIVELLNYMRDDDEFDRYMAPQTISNRHKERDIEAIDRNEIFYFYVNENPLKVDEKISGENSIITVTVFLTLLRLLCKKPLMGRMMKKEKNLTGKVKGKIVIEKNIRANTMHGRNDRFYCQYLQFSEDIIENQILKAALKKSKRFVIEYFKDCGKDNNNYTSMISYCSNALRNISDIQCDGEACNENNIHFSLNAEVNDLLNRSTDGFKTEFAFFTSKCEIYQILSNVRNKILEWALVLEDNGIIGEGMAFTDEEKKKAQDTGIVNNYTNNFYSDVSDIEMEQG